MAHPILVNYRYYLNDNIHFFIVKNADHNLREKKVLYYKGNDLLASERLTDQSFDMLKASFEMRKSQYGNPRGGSGFNAPPGGA
jgi:hypothetical protein